MATQFTAVTPVVIPPVDAKVYDRYWLTSFNVRAETPGKKVRLNARFMPCRDAGDGVTELQPNGREIGFTVEDLDDACSKDASLAAIVDSVKAKLLDLGIANGVFAAPATTTTTTLAPAQAPVPSK